MKLKTALILSVAVVALGMSSVSISKAYAADGAVVATTADVKADAHKGKKAAHHKKHVKHVAHKKEATPAAAEVPATNQ